MEPEQIRALVHDRLGVDAGAIERMTTGRANVTYDVRLADGRRVIVRTNADPGRMRGVSHNLPILRSLGLPVPRLIAEGPGWLILDHIPGRDLRYELADMTRSQMTRLAEHVVGFQRAAEALPPAEGYGWRPIGEPGRWRTWRALVEDEVERYARQAAPLLRSGQADRLRQRIADRADYLDAVPPTPFLDDLTTKNVLLERGELSGIVDFDVVCYGDPLYWLGLTTTAVYSDCPPSGMFYVDELRRFYEADAEVVGLYASIFALEFVRTHTVVDAWVERMLDLMG